MKITVHETMTGEFELDPVELSAKIAKALRKAADTYQSHTFEPKVGDLVKNVNPKCIHHGSEGTVTAVKSLTKGRGTTVRYRCTNGGPKWGKGDILEKTLDQLAPMTTKKSLGCDHDHEPLRKSARGGEVDVLEDMTGMVSDLYRERMAQLRADIEDLDVEG